MTVTRLWINDKWMEGAHVKRLADPHTGATLAEIGCASAEQAELAIEAAARAFGSWRLTPAHERADILYRAADLLERRKEEAAALIAKEAAKPIAQARGELDRTLQTYRFSAEAAKSIEGRVIPMDAAPKGDNHVGYTIREPLGVVSAITPFNFPFNLVAHKVGPALAAGNAIVLKPAEQTPLSALFLAELFREAGLPAGVLNIIPGSGEELGGTLTDHPKVAYVTFTGSPRVGKLIRSQAGLRKVTLELGSNSPLLIDRGFGERELEAIAAQTAVGAFAYNGQVCISIQRVYVHESIYEPFVNLLTAKAEALKIGNPLEEDTDITALINEDAARRLREWLNGAVSLGARIRCGGRFDGTVMLPTVLTEVPPEAELMKEEAFGPVVSVNPFHDWEEAIAMAGDSRFGLNAGAFTKDIERAFQAIRGIPCGAVLINEIPSFRVDHMPYGGVKDSGSGREGVRYALEEMTETKFVSFRTGVYEP